MKVSSCCLKANFIFIWPGSTIQRSELVPEKDATRAKTMLSGNRLKREREMEQLGSLPGEQSF